MAERMGRYIIYSADDEMPDCISCDHFGDNFDCSKSCGAEHGWYGYRRTEDTRTPKERGADKPKITCLNCKHLMFSDMYGECNKQLRIVKPSDTCEFAEPKERGGEK